MEIERGESRCVCVCVCVCVCACACACVCVRACLPGVCVCRAGILCVCSSGISEIVSTVLYYLCLVLTTLRP